MSPPLLVFLAPLLLLFEVGQLVVAERYLGVKQIQGGIDPRTLVMSETLAFGWSLAIFANWLWMGIMLSTSFGQGQIASMLAISFFGYALRRNCRMKWVLMILTFEGAIRIGMNVSLLMQAWQAM